MVDTSSRMSFFGRVFIALFTGRAAVYLLCRRLSLVLLLLMLLCPLVCQWHEQGLLKNDRYESTSPAVDGSPNHVDESSPRFSGTSRSLCVAIGGRHLFVPIVANARVGDVIPQLRAGGWTAYQGCRRVSPTYWIDDVLQGASSCSIRLCRPRKGGRTNEDLTVSFLEELSNLERLEDHLPIKPQKVAGRKTPRPPLAKAAARRGKGKDQAGKASLAYRESVDSIWKLITTNVTTYQKAPGVTNHCEADIYFFQELLRGMNQHDSMVATPMHMHVMPESTRRW